MCVPPPAPALLGPALDLHPAVLHQPPHRPMRLSSGPPRQNRCRAHRTFEPGGDVGRTSWRDTDKHSRTRLSRGCCHRASLRDVAQEFGVSIQTLEKWRDAALSQPVASKAWTPALLRSAADNGSPERTRAQCLVPRPWRTRSSSWSGAGQPPKHWAHRRASAAARHEPKPIGAASRNSSATCAAKTRRWQRPRHCWCFQKLEAIFPRDEDE